MQPMLFSGPGNSDAYGLYIEEKNIWICATVSFFIILHKSCVCGQSA